MADTVTTATQKLTRDQIAAIFGNNPRAIKLFELLVQDVSTTIPDAMDEVQYSALFSLHGDDGSKQAAQHAQQVAIEMQSLLTATTRAQADLAALRKEVEMLRSELADMRSRAMSTLSQVQAQAREALTLSIGV